MSGVSFVGFDSKDLLKKIVFFSVEIGGLLEEGGLNKSGEVIEVGGVRELSLSRSSRPARSSG